MAQIPIPIANDPTDLADDVRELLEELASGATDAAGTQGPYTGDCHPALDVRETDRAVEVTIDVAGVASGAIRILFRAGVLLIVGEKAPIEMPMPPVFHLVEREFGRFARAVRLHGAFDVVGAKATLRDGELTIVLPKIAERRGQGHRIPIA